MGRAQAVAPLQRPGPRVKKMCVCAFKHESRRKAGFCGEAYVSTFGTKKRRVEPPVEPAELPDVKLNELPDDIHGRTRDNLDCRDYTNMCLATRRCNQWKRALRAHEFDTSVAYELVSATEKMCTKRDGTDDDCMRFAAMCKERHQAIDAVSKDPTTIQTFPEHLINDKEVVLAAIAKNAVWLSGVVDRKVVLAAVKQNGLLLEFGEGMGAVKAYVHEFISESQRPVYAGIRLACNCIHNMRDPC